MKTTLDLSDQLLIQAKQVAARRRTTLKALVEQALRRELAPPQEAPPADPDHYEIGDLGFLVLKKRAATVTTETINQMIEDAGEEDLQEALRRAGRS